MKVMYNVNNYMLGAKVRTTPTHKIIEQKRIDKNHTNIIYELDTLKEKEFCDKVLAKKGKIIE